MEKKTHFIRTLSFFDTLMLGLGFVIGAGIFIMPMLMAQQSGTFSLIAWAAAGVYCILTSLSFAECAARMPIAGGPYAYAHKVFGNASGFLCGYTLWTSYWITIAAELWAIAWYLRFFLPYGELPRLGIACGIGLLLTYTNYRGVRKGSEMQDALTVVKLLALILFIAVGLSFLQPERLQLVQGDGELLPGFLASLLLALWAYQGAEIITIPEEEIKSPRKNVPKALIICVLAVMALYLLVSVVVLGSVEWREFATSETPIADMMASFVGGWGGVALALGGLIAIIGAMNAVTLGAARLTYAMARDGLFPRFFDYLSPRYETPSRALWLHFAMASCLALLVNNFATLAMLVVAFILIPHAISAFVALRGKCRFAPRWIHYVVAALSLALAAYALSQSLLPAFILMVAGALLYELVIRRKI
ncbi:Amino acid permease [Candidatus Norongarragalina meridionalis]|nr:Amino acid permease [Candidatus Norongarragalina meridionalis]